MADYAGRDAPGDVNPRAIRVLKRKNDKDFTPGSLREIGRVAYKGRSAASAARLVDSATGASTFLKAVAGMTTGAGSIRSKEELFRRSGAATEQIGMMALPFPSKIIKLPSGRELRRVAVRHVDEALAGKKAPNDGKYFGWTGAEDDNIYARSYRYRPPRSGSDTQVAYNLHDKGGEKIGSIRKKVGKDNVYVDEVFIKPEKRGPSALMDLVSQVPKYMEKDEATGEYKRTVSASLANSGIPRLLDMMSRRDPALGRAGRGDLEHNVRRELRDQRNAERRDAIREKAQELGQTPQWASDMASSPSGMQWLQSRARIYQRGGLGEEAAMARARREWQDMVNSDLDPHEFAPMEEEIVLRDADEYAIQPAQERGPNNLRDRLRDNNVSTQELREAAARRRQRITERDPSSILARRRREQAGMDRWRHAEGERDQTLAAAGHQAGTPLLDDREGLRRVGVAAARVIDDGRIRVLLEDSPQFINVTPGTFHKAAALVRTGQALNMRTALRRLRSQNVDIHGGGEADHLAGT